uniref:Uncharacterized protein n=1 Tax=Arundo donax TaxID=35708 RepID=A0A0A9C8Y5_ARUDO
MASAVAGEPRGAGLLSDSDRRRPLPGSRGNTKSTRMEVA